jgi:hypothetical protein
MPPGAAGETPGQRALTPPPAFLTGQVEKGGTMGGLTRKYAEHQAEQNRSCSGYFRVFPRISGYLKKNISRGSRANASGKEFRPVLKMTRA